MRMFCVPSRDNLLVGGLYALLHLHAILNISSSVDTSVPILILADLGVWHYCAT